MREAVFPAGVAPPGNPYSPSAGTTLDQVVKVTVFLRREEDFAGFNRVFADFFAPPYPARSTLVAPPAGSELLVEVEAVALSTIPAATP